MKNRANIKIHAAFFFMLVSMVWLMLGGMILRDGLVPTLRDKFWLVPTGKIVLLWVGVALFYYENPTNLIKLLRWITGIFMFVAPLFTMFNDSARFIFGSTEFVVLLPQMIGAMVAWGISWVLWDGKTGWQR